jgi:hypothetical protein
MDRQFHLKTVVLGAAILFVFAYVGGVLIARERLADLRSELLVQISEQQTLLFAIAETTARNGADEITERVVKDCSIEERTEFDALLGRLNSSLSKTELTTLERLFGRCGSFYAERKSVMVARLEREVEVYENYVTQLEQIGRVNTKDFKVELWKQLVDDENKQSIEFGSLVQHQDKIISALLEGKSVTSPDIKKILDEVKQVQQSLETASLSAGEKRRALDAL